MQYNYLKITWRNLWKDKFYSIINIAGLAFATAVFLLIINYVRFEHSYENFHTKADHIYRVTLDLYKDGAFLVTDCETHPPLGPTLKKQMPEVKEFVRMRNMGLNEVNTQQHTAFLVEKVYAADPSLFSVFNYKFIQGDSATALKGPMEAVITETTAKKIFGNENAIGKSLTIKSETVTIVGIVKDVPENTHLKFDVLLSFPIIEKFGYSLDSWNGNNNYTYLEMAPNTNLSAFNAKLKAFSKTRLKNRIMVAEPIPQIHLHSKKTFEPEVNGDAKTVQFLFIIAFMILLIGTINYVNLTTARAAERLKEASVKKILGASRWLLIQQFFAESIFINILAFLLALLIIKLALPFYANIAGMPVSAGIFSTAYFWGICLLLFCSNCLLSGLYPSFALSAVKAVSAVNRSFTSTLKGGSLRKTLVIGQFTVAAVVLVASVIVYKQLNFMRNQDLGMNLEEILVLRGPDLDSTSSHMFKNELMQLPGVKKAAVAGSIPGLGLSTLSTTTSITAVGAAPGAGYNYYIYSIDADFVPALDIKIAAGHNFIAGETNKDKVLINEEACRLLGFKTPLEAIGRKINFWGGHPVITGVLKNYHQRSLKEALLPMIHWYSEKEAGYYALKVNTHTIRQTIAGIEKKWQEHFKDHPFEYYFLNDVFNQQYQADTHFGKIVSVFSLFTIFITCLGLLGLTSYSVARRTKEIGIRKVLGASVAGIMHLLTKDFIRLVMVAIVIATPVAWWTMNRWLQDFAYRISIPWWVFAFAGILLALVAILTVGFQSLKAALTNPVKSLGSE